MNKPCILSGPQLIEVLRVTVQSVKMLDVTGHTRGYLHPDHAIPIVRSGMYQGKCSRTRVHYIREIPDTRPANTPDYSYRIDRPMLNACPVNDIRPWEKWAARTKAKSKA